MMDIILGDAPLVAFDFGMVDAMLFGAVRRDGWCSHSACRKTRAEEHNGGKCFEIHEKVDQYIPLLTMVLRARKRKNVYTRRRGCGFVGREPYPLTKRLRVKCIPCL